MNETTFRDLTYYGIGGPVGSVHFPDCIAALQNLWKRLSTESARVALIGAGSNVLCSDESFDGDVVSCRSMSGWQILSLSDSATAMILVEAGVSNTECAELGLELGFLDLAWMFRMPGQLGATIRMNARCYGGEISQVVSHVFTIQQNGAMRACLGADVFVGYKDTSLMKNKEVVAAAIIELRRQAPRSEVLRFMEDCEADRHRKQHFLFPSCGSTFKNNYAVGKPSGQIFDELGFKGMRVGGAQVSDFHGNFVFNRGDALAADVLELASRMSASASQQGMPLELEVQPVGAFSSTLASRLKFDALDPDTIALDGEKVLTGLASYGCESPQRSRLGPAQAQFPAALAAVPFAGWNAEHGAGQELVLMEVTQHRGLDAAAASLEPLLRIAFRVARAEHLEELLAVKPPRSGFQDGLWESSVFECFIFAPEPSACYLELEVHDECSWLALAFDGIRKRQHASAAALPKIPGIRTFAESIEGRVQVGFDLSFAALEPYLSKGGILLKGAYAGWRTYNGALVRRYATAPPRGRETYLSAAAPDFHSRRDLLELPLFR